MLRLNDSRFGSGATGRDVNNIWDYLRFGPIGRAFLAKDRRILLLDEIDKTDSDTQDNLLDVLEDGSFVIRRDQSQGDRAAAAHHRDHQQR